MFYHSGQLIVYIFLDPVAAAMFKIGNSLELPAPEVIKSSNRCNLAVDIWSLGWTLLEMTTTKPPWTQYEGKGELPVVSGNGRWNAVEPLGGNELPTKTSSLGSIMGDREPINRVQLNVMIKDHTARIMVTTFGGLAQGLLSLGPNEAVITRWIGYSNSDSGVAFDLILVSPSLFAEERYHSLDSLKASSPTFGSTGTAFGVSNAPVFGKESAFRASSMAFFALLLLGLQLLLLILQVPMISEHLDSGPAFGQSSSAFGNNPLDLLDLEHRVLLLVSIQRLQENADRRSTIVMRILVKLKISYHIRLSSYMLEAGRVGKRSRVDMPVLVVVIDRLDNIVDLQQMLSNTTYKRSAGNGYNQPNSFPFSKLVLQSSTRLWFPLYFFSPIHTKSHDFLTFFAAVALFAHLLPYTMPYRLFFSLYCSGVCSSVFPLSSVPFSKPIRSLSIAAIVAAPPKSKKVEDLKSGFATQIS
ncbi:hypothetical protein COLO4_16282 [Corchorus olitorius]|uniref:Protein kinase domain-containing protein n=1 Tax=Corchorus olitorius TaxID=93759 RepID=A0A1R3JIC3_9ROSI|nr:hypothetical protein COLO4_16282 [Corchorus olitorius]